MALARTGAGTVGRRRFLRLLCGAAVGCGFGGPARGAPQCPALARGPKVSEAALGLTGLAAARERFTQWLYGSALLDSPEVLHMVRPQPAAHPDVADLGLTGLTILWMACRGRHEDARHVALALLRWQQLDRVGKLALSYGAVASQLRRGDSGWTGGSRFATVANLDILEGLLAVHQATPETAVLNGAVGVATWLVEVMCRGRELGVWHEAHGAPMREVSAAGVVEPRIGCGYESLRITALNRLGEVAGEAAYCHQAARAMAFYAASQRPAGLYMDHYDPGAPPQPFDARRFALAAVEGVPTELPTSGESGVSTPPALASEAAGMASFRCDHMLAAALGAARAGDLEGGRRLLAWLPGGAGPVPRRIRLGSDGRPMVDGEEQDLLATGLRRSLFLWLGDGQSAARDWQLLLERQRTDGAWPRYVRPGLAAAPADADTATGLWATADLSISGEKVGRP